MIQRELVRLDEEETLYLAVEALALAGYDRPVIEKALIAYAPVDLDLLANCYVRVLRNLQAAASLSCSDSKVA